MPTLAADKMRLIVTGNCNLDCFYCHNEGQAKEDTFAQVDFLTRVIDAVKRAGVGVNEVTISGGEPLLHPRLDEVVALAATLCDRVALVTNGVLASPQRVGSLARAGLSKLRLGVDSLDATKPRPSPGRLDKPFAAASVIAAAREFGLAVDINTVVTKFNSRQIGELACFAVDHGLSIKFFEHVEVAAFGGAGIGGSMAATPHVSFDDFAAQVLATLGGPAFFEPAPLFGEANMRCFANGVEIRYCRYLCPFGLCWLTGTRVDPQGYVYNCMSNRGVDRLADVSSARDMLHTIDIASKRACRDGLGTRATR
jgi:MoaA/NifB/PqqE/SkfB family radical SAM enzyme